MTNYEYDKAQRLKQDFRKEKQREFYRKIALQKLDSEIPDRPRELRLDFRPHKVQFSEVVKQAFAKGIYQYLP